MHDHHEHHENHGHREITPTVLLRHMVEHNESHNAELSALAETLDDAARAQVLSAVALMRQGNEKLKEALNAMKEA